jgi:hypothetical protein
MQHLLLALSIITLTIIAGNDRRKTLVEKSNLIMKVVEKPKVNNADNDPWFDEPSVYFSQYYIP